MKKKRSLSFKKRRENILKKLRDKKYYLKNKDKKAEYMQRYYQENKEELNLKQKNYGKKNKQKIREYFKKYYQNKKIST